MYFSGKGGGKFEPGGLISVCLIPQDAADVARYIYLDQVQWTVPGRTHLIESRLHLYFHTVGCNRSGQTLLSADTNSVEVGKKKI